jgi:hypothetical protein
MIKARKITAKQLRPGDVCAFATMTDPTSAQPTGRYAALRVLDVRLPEELIFYVALDGIFTSVPGFAAAASLPPLRQVSFNFNGWMAVWGSPLRWRIAGLPRGRGARRSAKARCAD